MSARARRLLKSVAQVLLFIVATAGTFTLGIWLALAVIRLTS